MGVDLEWQNENGRVLDGNGDGYVDTELTSEAEVLDHESMGYLTITEANFYFECPLLPRRGR